MPQRVLAADEVPALGGEGHDVRPHAVDQLHIPMQVRGPDKRPVVKVAQMNQPGPDQLSREIWQGHVAMLDADPPVLERPTQQPRHRHAAGGRPDAIAEG